MNSILLRFSPFLYTLVSLHVYAANDTQNFMLVGGGGTSAAGDDTTVTIRGNFLAVIQNYMIGLLGVVTVSVFMYIGFKLFTSRGHDEEHKNAWKALSYAVVGLAVMPLAYVLVKVITGFTL